MGVEASTELQKQFQEIANWPKMRVDAVTRAYAEGEYDFGIDYGVVMNITGYEAEDAKELIKVHSKNDSGIVNAITLLISIISLGDIENKNEVGRLESIFDLMDFSHNSQISMDELTILLLCVAASFSFIISNGQSNEDENKDALVIQFAKKIYESLDKKPTSHISKDELCDWAKDKLFNQGIVNINDILRKLTVADVIVEVKS